MINGSAIIGIQGLDRLIGIETNSSFLYQCKLAYPLIGLQKPLMANGGLGYFLIILPEI